MAHSLAPLSRDTAEAAVSSLAVHWHWLTKHPLPAIQATGCPGLEYGAMVRAQPA
jgi:hypothetical protein